MFNFSLSTTTLTLLVLALSACTATLESTSRNTHPQTDIDDSSGIESSPTETQTLEGVDWQLVSLDGSPLVQNSRVSLLFEDGRISGSAGCNRYMGSYSTDGESLALTSPLALTRRACINAALSRQEMDYMGILRDITRLHTNGDELELSTATGRTLVYSRPPQETATTDDDVVTLIVGPHRVPCVGVAPMRCLQTRATESEPWQLMYSPIEGFNHQEGVTSTLRVRRIDVPNPPADGSSIRTVLVEVVSSVREAPAPQSPPAQPVPEENTTNEDQHRCGGIAGFQCPAGLRCVDRPNDGCDPSTGGRDCMGICVAP